MLENETTISRERLLKLYKELRGVSPPKGMLPLSTDWFIAWQPNIHASLFINVYHFMRQHANLCSVEAVIKAYRLYLEHLPPEAGEEPLMSLTRAWTLIRFFDSKMLILVECRECHGHFLGHTYALHGGYRCGLCHPPSRAGKKKRIEPNTELVH